jgi:MFS family permease
MNETTPRTSNFGKWMALTAALLGWLFDGLEMGLFPLVQRPCLQELVGAGEQDITRWIAVITSFFLIGAATGGVLFGWLGDRIGRVRAMMLSVLTYALVSALCGFVDQAWQIGVLRFVAALGMGGEWSLGVALINELWPDRSRAFLAGLIGAAANVGYLLIAAASIGLVHRIGDVRGFLELIALPSDWIEVLLRNEGWRFLMMLGAVPALLTFLIRIFVPESERWLHEKGKGATSHWATYDLFSVLLGALAAAGIIWLWAGDWPLAVSIVGSIVCFPIVTIGYLWPVVRYLHRARAAAAWRGSPDPSRQTVSAGTDGSPDPSHGGSADHPHVASPGARPAHEFGRAALKHMLVAACLSGVALLGTWGSTQQAPTIAAKMLEDARKEEAKREHISVSELPPPPPARGWTLLWASAGAVLGTILAAFMGDWFGRRIAYVILCVGSFVILQVFLNLQTAYNDTFLVLAFLVGAITASFYGWLPLYLPELFPTAIRATGQGFGFNFGRVLAAIGVLQLGNLQAAFGGLPQACAALSFVYVVGVIAIWFVPETKGQPLPE